VNTKNLSDLTNGDEGATRFTRGLLIGPSTTPDAFSGRVETNGPSALGVILENDGETYAGNNAPAARFLINSYSGNLDDLTEYPTWAVTGPTGNLSLDLPQLKAPTLQLKAFRGAKSTGNVSSYKLQAGDVVGKIVFSPGQTDGASVQGGDLVNGPSGITVDVGDANVTYVANAYMHITTTPDPGTNLGYMRNKANVEGGANQQTNFTTKGGNVTIAAQTNGMITLAPTPDYGDASNATVWTRYPGTTHEYHTFLNAGFADKTNKTGTLIELQPKSGTTTGSGGVGYDSVGNVTLKMTTHESNSDIKGFWDLEFDQSGQGLHLSKDGTEKVKFTADLTVYSSIPVVPSYSNTSLPTSVAGGQIFVTNGNNKPAYGDGTNWYYYDDTQVT
jgi:plastocyanin